MVYNAKSDISGTISAFNYRKKLTINHSGALTSYQVKLTVDHVNTNMKTDFGDIRFNTDTGNYIPYWIETKVNDTSADVWIKVDLANGDTIIYMYYGNIGLTGASDVTGTFVRVIGGATQPVVVALNFDDNANDLSGNGNNATLYGDATYITGKFGKGITLDGSGDYVSMVNSASFAFGSGDFSVSIWIKRGRGNTFERIMGQYRYSEGISGNPLLIYFGANGQLGAAYAWGTATGQSDSIDSGINYLTDTSSYHYIVFEKSGINLKLYLDGIEVGSSSGGTHSQIATASNFSIGRLGEYTADYVLGIVDSFRIYKGYALSLDDITAIKDNYGYVTTNYPGRELIRKYAATEPTICAGGEEVSTVSWLTGWNRRKKLTITGSTSGAQTDYQIKSTVHKATGTDTSTDIYLGTNVNNDFSDLRFTSNDGSTNLNYWIESITGSAPYVATVWIKIPSIPISPCTTTIYIYYDNTGATSIASDGNGTFIFFDDFESGIIDTNKWSTQLMYGTMGIRTDYKYGNYSYGSDQGPSQGCCYPGSVNPDQNHYFMKLPDGNNIQYLVSMKTKRWITTVWYSYCYIGFGGSNMIYTLPYDNVWRNYDIILKRTSSSNINYQIAVNGIWGTAANITITQGTILPFGVQTSHYGPSDNSVYVRSDDFRVRKYVSPEPTFSTTGPEETQLPANITATGMTISQSETPCRTGICTLSVSVTWTNNGGSTGSFVPSITASSGTVTETYSSEQLVAGAPATHSFTVSGMAAGTCSICPNPN